MYGGEEGIGPVGREREAVAGFAIRVPGDNGILETTGSTDDRDSAVAQSIQLRQAPRLIEGRHKQHIRTGDYAMRKIVAEPDFDANTPGIF